MPDELFQEPDNATQLTLEERADLIPAHIGYRSELNAAEQENITRGQDWRLPASGICSARNSSRISTPTCRQLPIAAKWIVAAVIRQPGLVAGEDASDRRAPEARRFPAGCCPQSQGLHVRSAYRSPPLRLPTGSLLFAPAALTLRCWVRATHGNCSLRRG